MKPNDGDLNPKQKAFMQEIPKIVDALIKRFGIEGICIVSAWAEPKGDNSAAILLNNCVKGSLPFRVHLGDMLAKAAKEHDAELARHGITPHTGEGCEDDEGETPGEDRAIMPDFSKLFGIDGVSES